MTDQQLNMEEVYDELRHAILERLREEIERKPRLGTQNIGVQQISCLLPGREIPARDTERVEALVCQIFHELYLERIVVPGTGTFSSHQPQMMQWSFYHITEHGRQILETREYSPYDPNGYLARLRSEIPTLDETVLRYVAESLQCLRMDCVLAAAVTLGCASEKAVLLLIEQFGQAISDKKKREKYEEETKSWIISRKYKAFRKNLDSVSGDLPTELRDPLEPLLHGTFELIRRIRNDAGHPTGEPITLAIVRAGQRGFPDYCKYVYSLMRHFAEKRVNL